MEHLCQNILPHQNCGSLKTRANELTAQFQSFQARISAPGILSEADKRELAKDCLDLAISLAKVPVKYEGDMLKQQRQHQERQQEPALQQEMG